MTSHRSLPLFATLGCVLALSACGVSDDGAATSSDAAPAASVVSTSPVVDEAPSTSTTTTAPVTSDDSTTTMPTTTPITTPTTTAPPATFVERDGTDAGATADVGLPLAIRIPSIGVDSELLATGYDADGAVAVPADADVAGWFEPGPRPGNRGSALIMGHVDSARTGPGVFFELRNIQVGDVATVDTETGPQDFVVDRVEQFPKLEFPTDQVYGPQPAAALRLVTCGGSFDRSARSYYDNIIVSLIPVES